jgi:hypothetical protein
MVLFVLDPTDTLVKTQLSMPAVARTGGTCIKTPLAIQYQYRSLASVSSQNWHIISQLLSLIAAEIEDFPAQLCDPQYPNLLQPRLQ